MSLGNNLYLFFWIKRNIVLQELFLFWILCMEGFYLLIGWWWSKTCLLWFLFAEGTERILVSNNFQYSSISLSCGLIYYIDSANALSIYCIYWTFVCGKLGLCLTSRLSIRPWGTNFHQLNNQQMEDWLFANFISMNN